MVKLGLIVALIAGVTACNSEGDDGGPAVIDAAAIDAAAGESCGPHVLGGCEGYFATEADCPTVAEACQAPGHPVCGASYTCCYCAPGATAWNALEVDCPICPDAGPDGPPDGL